MRRLPPSLAALWLLAACASAPQAAPPPEPLADAPRGPTETYGPLIEAAAAALIAAEPAGAVPRRLEVTVLEVEESGGGLFYSAELHTPGRRDRRQDYVIYGQCAAADLDACARQVVSGARMLVGAD